MVPPNIEKDNRKKANKPYRLNLNKKRGNGNTLCFTFSSFNLLLSSITELKLAKIGLLTAIFNSNN